MIMNPALLLPLRLIDNNNINSGFDGNYSGRQIEDWQSKSCYFQKWQTSDTLKLQLISDTALADLIIYELDGSIADTVPWTVNALLLPSYPTFLIYEISYPMANLAVGKYVIQQEQFEAEPIDVQQTWENTLLIKYKHSVNDYDVVFSTTIEFEFRIEGWIGNYQPKRNSEVYPDQTRNLTQLSALAYPQFTLYIGFKEQVPTWAINKVNLITQCNQISINNTSYQTIEDAEFEIENNTDNNTATASIDIEQKINNFNKYETSGSLPNQSYQPVLTVTPYPNVGANFNVTGLFKFASVLQLICIYRISTNPITVRFGITPGGNEIGEMLLLDFENTLLVDYAFGSASTVYVSGIGSGDDITIYLAWYQLDALPIPINGGGGTPAVDSLGAGFVGIYIEPAAGDFLLNWDMGTGLGKPNTKWTKWCILGSNGTLEGLDSKDVYFRHVGFENIIDNYLTLNTVIGENQKLIPREALPAEGLHLLSGTVAGNGIGTPGPDDPIARARAQSPANALNYELVKGTGDVTLGISEDMGEGADFDVTPKTVISLYIFKLVD